MATYHPLFLLFVVLSLFSAGKCWIPFTRMHQHRISGLKSGEEVPRQLVERYLEIKYCKKDQEKNFKKWIKNSNINLDKMTQQANSLGLNLNVTDGHISYQDETSIKFGPKNKLSFDLVYVRHGKTDGNTEPRVFQGYVDQEWNQLNVVGIAQAKEAADQLDALNLSPDLVVVSPLTRVKDTARAYLSRHPELEPVTEIWDSTHEMSFGDWENVHVKDLDDSDIAHLFYLQQNAIVKSDEVSNVDPTTPIENFIDVLVRMSGVLKEIEDRMYKIKSETPSKTPLVLMYGHSMAGAAVGILTGQGKVVDNKDFLGFDGKYILPNATPVFLHKVSDE